MIPVPGAVWRYGAVFALGLAIAGTVQGWRYGEREARAEKAAAESQLAAVEAAGAEFVRQNTETERRRYLLAAQSKSDDDAENSRDGRIAAGVERVYVRASCPSVRPAAADAGGAGTGAAELDAAYRHALSQLRREASEQLRLLNFCRSELRARSAPQSKTGPR